MCDKEHSSKIVPDRNKIGEHVDVLLFWRKMCPSPSRIGKIPHFLDNVHVSGKIFFKKPAKIGPFY